MKLLAKKIERNTKNITIHSFGRVDSTNTVAKRMAASGAKEGTVVIAQQQTAGRGRLGRTFVSKKGGIYLSLVLRPRLSPDQTLFITTAAAVAVCRAIESVSDKKCDIKWVNDVYIDGKKVCGILTEGEFNSDGELDFAILGVGINLFEPKGHFPANLPLADSVFHKENQILLKNRLKARVVSEFLNEFVKIYENLDKKDFINEYQKRSFLTGKEITYLKDGLEQKAVVVGIDDEARLVVKQGDKEIILSHGEIQIVGMEQLAI